MRKSLFNTIRSSQAIRILLTGFMSAFLVLSPFIQIVGQSDSALGSGQHIASNYGVSSSAIGNKEINYDANPNNIITDKVAEKLIKDAKKRALPKKHYPNTFYAVEEQGVIGIETPIDKESPSDNFFTINIPEGVDLNDLEVLLKYDVYGVEDASHTTKSINNSLMYGGQVVTVNDSWTAVEEYVPTHFFKKGYNDIFFNRRADETYQYKVKDLRVELVTKKQQQIVLTQPTPKNQNGQIHLMGYTSEPVKEIFVLGQTVPVEDGIFEHVLENVPEDVQALQLGYVNGTLQQEIIPIDFEGKAVTYTFKKSEAIEANSLSISSLEETVSFKNLTLNFEGEDEKSLIKGQVEGLDFKALKPLNSDLSNVTAGKYLGYRTEVTRLKDNAITKIHLSYDASLIPDGYSDKDVRTFAFDKQKRVWVPLPVDSLAYESKTVISFYNGDTDYINGVIKVPEMAETASFAPTTITDMEYANPSAGIVSISPPSPNSTGAATTSFPIKLPAGRNGMMPSLSVNYNSEAGNGWMGKGWNMQLPAITLDTRWGVPRFDFNHETEIYQLNGETMVLKVGDEYTNPHRYTSDIPRASNRIFYLRKEGNYLQIQRMGTHSGNYYWVVTDKQGNTSYYGNTSNSRIEHDFHGVITHWALSKTVDPSGNMIEYTYQTNDIITNNGVPAQSFYPSSIKYTLKEGAPSPNYYQVDFLRSSGREDISLNARTGTMVVIDELLSRINIGLYENGQLQPIRSYQFDYIDAVFNKKQLSKISEYDAGGQLFYSNTMEYYDEIGNSQLINPNIVNWDGDDESISVFGGIASNGTALGAGTTSGFSAGLRVGVGVGTNPTSTTNTIGGSYNYSQSKEKTKISLIDINGDGLSDKVFKNGGVIQYLPNLGTGNGFGDAINVELSNLDETKSRTNTFGYDASIGLSEFSVGAGRSHSRTRTETGGYFTDFNGDGMPDIISGSSVRFNTTAPWDDNQNPVINFNTNAAFSANTIYSGQVNPNIVPDLQLETLDELRSDHPQFDHVKAWQAPYSGTISIQSIATLMQLNTCNTEGYQNRFRLTIEQAAQNQSSGTTQRISIGGANEWILQTLNQSRTLNRCCITVEKGETLFFRIHNEEYGCGGEVEWNPTITYNAISAPGNVVNTEDEHGKNMLVFDAADDFIINNGGTWTPRPEDHTISFDYYFRVNFVAQNVSLSDEVRFVVKKIRYTHETDPNSGEYGQITDQDEYTRMVRLSTDGTLIVSGSTLGTMANISGRFINEDGPYSYVYHFYAESDSNVEWDEINWKPIVTNQDGTVHFPPINYSTYDNNINTTNYKFTTNLNTSPDLSIDPNITGDADSLILRISHDMFEPSDLYKYFIEPFEEEEFPIKINWVVKVKDDNGTKPLHKATFYLHRGQCHNPSFDPVYCDYEFRTAETGGVVIDPGMLAFKDYFIRDLTKQEALDIMATSGEIFGQFYLESDRFGLNNPANITIQLHPGQESNYSFTTDVLQQPFTSIRPSFLGNTYRSWGQFLYNGGLKYHYNDEGDFTGTIDNFEGNIDMSVFGFFANPEDVQNQNQPNSDELDPNTVVRYILYSQDNQNDKYDNATIITRIDVSDSERVKAGYAFNNSNLVSALGRFGEPNLHDLHVSAAELGLNGSTGGTTGFVGLKQRSLSLGRSTNGEVNIGGGGLSGTFSEGYSKVLNQYTDINGDRYPDLVTDGNIQLTSMKGGLSNLNLPNSFVAGSESEDNTAGVTIAGVLPNSTAADNANTNSPTRTNVNSGINSSSGATFNSKQWMDINGDGLSDQVTITRTEIKVRLNRGYFSFGEEVIWSNGLGLQDLNVSTRNNSGVSLGGGSNVPIDDPMASASFAFGIGASMSNSFFETLLVDVNADGLPDLLVRIGTEYRFYINNGAHFEQTANQVFYDDTVDLNRSTTGNIYGSFTAGFWFPIPILPPPAFIPIKVTGTPTASVNGGINEKMVTIQDIDGDGYPDVLQSGSDNGDIRARLNKIGKTHLLKTVNLPLGGSWTVDYEREGNTYKLPQNKWVMNEVTTYDGFTADNNWATDETLSTFSYENPNHDRREREFLGFETVRVDQKNPNTQDTYRYSVTSYHNENVYLKGLPKTSASYDANDELLIKNTTLYNLLDPENPQVHLNASASQNYLQGGLSAALLDYSRLFVAPAKTVSIMYEGADSLVTEQQFLAYDANGNLLTYKNLGDTYASEEDAYRTEMEYYPSIPGVANSTGFVEKMQVFRDSDNKLMRERTAQYSNNQAKLGKVTTKLNDTESSFVKIDYDSYGNPIKITQADGFITSLVYETTLHIYPTQTSNSFGESSSTVYDYKFGIPVLTTDINNQEVRTRIDNRGRVVEVTAPNEMNTSGWTLRMYYEDQSADVFTDIPNFTGSNYVIPASGSFEAIAAGNFPTTTAKHHAMTSHYVEQAHSNQLRTVSLVDGLGQAIQLKKTLFANNTLKWLISGKETKDAFGRVIEARLPSVQSAYPNNPVTYSMSQNVIPPTVMAYDVRDRLISVQQAGETQTSNTTYSIAEGMFVTTVTNELDQTFETFTDIRGRQRKTIQNKELTTKFYYNAVDEKIKVRNHQGYDTHYAYDLAGRRIEERHPDYGLQIFKYDLIGNLIARKTSNVILEGAGISYEYDHNRLTKIIYPQNPENNVEYTYGAPGNANRATGRLFMQKDASGVQVFGYDRLGNMDRHLRGVSVAGRNTFWYSTKWTYDSHNRVREIIYPDYEEVAYNYNTGGTLKNIKRTTISGIATNDPIVSNIAYNDLGERTQITYGNGTSTSYTYDNRRRLQDLSHQFTGFGLTNRYGYDELNNVTSVATLNPNANLPGNGQLGGPVNYAYNYDDYNRLVMATGRYTGPDDLGTNLLAQEYTLNMKYDLAHNIISKIQTHVQGSVTNANSPISDPQTILKNDYSLNYAGYAEGAYVVPGDAGEFGYVQPHAQREIVEAPGTVEVDPSDPRYKKHLVDYDANGNQTEIRLVVNDAGTNSAIEGIVAQEEMVIRRQLWDEEDRLRAVDLNPEENAPHPLAVYTYDVGGQRVVRYIPGRADIKSNANTVSNNEQDEVMIYPNALVTAKPTLAPGLLPTSTESITTYTKHYYIGAERVNSTIGTVTDLGLFPKWESWFHVGLIRPMANQATQAAHAALQNTYSELGQDFVLPTPQLEGEMEVVYESDRFDTYYYHSDHLGSSSYISNANGMVSQHLEYLPFGETLVDEHLNSYNTPYKFNGKELDEETGNYYYGARYYNPKWSVWLSVDPMWEKYPNESPYIYTSNNPVKYIDPDGREKIIVTGGEYTSKKRYKYNFVEPSIKQLKSYKASAGDEAVTWAVMNVGYSKSSIKKMRSIAKENGVNFVLLNSADELTNYVNSKSTSSSDLSDARTSDQVTEMSVFGHGYVGSMEFGHNQSEQDKFSYGMDDAANLDGGAFNSPTIDIYTCNALTPTEGEYSFLNSTLGGAIYKKSKGTLSGYFGRTDYAKMNIGESWGDKWSRMWNGFNTNGSISLPTAGTKTVNGASYPSTKVTLGSQ